MTQVENNHSAEHNQAVAKDATIAFLNSGKDITTALRECYTFNDFTGIVDGLNHCTLGPIDRTFAKSEIAKRVAVLRTILHRVAAELDVPRMTIKAKVGEALSVLVAKPKSKNQRAASFLQAQKDIHKAISDLSALRSVPGFAEFHIQAIQALTELRGMPEFVQTVETRVIDITRESAD